MADDTDILSAIAANHAAIVNLIEGLAQSTKTGLDRVESRFDRVEARLDRVEARLDRVESGVRELQSNVTRIETKLHDTRIEALEARP